MSKINPAAPAWLLETAHPRHWADLYFEGSRYGHLTSNIAESLNAWLLSAREMPILAMLETIRQQLMTWFVDRRKIDSITQGLLVSKVATEMQRLINERGRRYRYIQSTDALYEVVSKETYKEYIVQLNKQTCSCRAWQSTGWPCDHALAIIINRGENSQTYAKSFYTLQTYRSTYANAIIHPRIDEFDKPLQFQLPSTIDSVGDIESDDSEFSDDGILPPNVRRQPGRPKKRRIRSQGENSERLSRRQKCGLCRETGHSKRTCKGPR